VSPVKSARKPNLDCLDVAVVDALDEQAADKHAKSVVDEAGSIDVSFNLITRGDAQGTPLTTRAAAQRMIEQR
jgi:hypothetical protein